MKVPIRNRFCLETTVLTCLLLLVSDYVFGQLIQGKVADQASKLPLPYVNIGILGSSVGTISNEDGTFSIIIPPSYIEDSLIFSMLGYERRVIQVRRLIDGGETSVYLEEKPTRLETVTIKGNQKKTKGYRLGNRYNKGGLIYGDSIAAGSAMALLIENKYPTYHEDLEFPVYARESSLFISKNTLDSFKIRVRFLSRHPATGLPDKDFFDQSIIHTSSVRHGWITFDLEPYQLIIKDPSFFLVFEWIMDERDRFRLIKQYDEFRIQNPNRVTYDTMIVAGEKVGFRSYHQFHAGTSFGVSPIPFSLQNYTCYFRTNSFGEWKRAPGILTARLLVTKE